MMDLICFEVKSTHLDSLLRQLSHFGLIYYPVKLLDCQNGRLSRLCEFGTACCVTCPARRPMGRGDWNCGQRMTQAMP
jgi:hypothetical protein